MADYPSGVYSPRTKENKAGVVYDADKSTIGYAEDITKSDAEVVAIETELGTLPKGADATVKAKLERLDSDKIEDVVDDTTPQLGGDLDVNKKNIQISEIPDDNKGVGVSVSIIAGETIAFPNICYIKSDGKLWKAKADVIATSSAICLALESKNADQACKVLLLGVVRDDDFAFTVGGLIYLSAATAGLLTQTAPSGEDNVIQILGVATHADRFLLNPQLVQVEYAA